MTHVFQVTLDPDFPLADVEAIASRLDASGGVHPGFIPPSVGALNLGAVFYAQHEGWSLVVLPDRNLVSRMARIAQCGAVDKRDKPTQVACDLMAFCQAMELQLEPSIACHELAACDGNAAAREELGWFRAADMGGQAREWIDLAMGRRERVELGEADPPELADLAFPLRRWRRNYVVCLKIAVLELQPGLPRDKALELLRWMYEDFQIAGPAALFALFYLAPTNSHRRLMRGLRAPDRQKAIAGVRNAAWDVTQLSDFIARVDGSEAERRRYFFATADESLAAVVPALFSGLDSADDGPALGDILRRVWPEAQAFELANALRRYVEAQDDPARPQPDVGPGFVEDAIAEGERWLMEWSPVATPTAATGDIL
ncbi:MAG: hypothetical protein Q8S03_04890 [Brevundimonas sp.]|uniref:hypothetical protein n=1 Tax=Brevundimonas sp. TaxID=1871086 RepID=UPI0027328522|nr:hypothetical protein [Brevundimonas sp.]MDP3404006.1 hypothetical protein [Brevundimonas sp.]